MFLALTVIESKYATLKSAEDVQYPAEANIQSGFNSLWKNKHILLISMQLCFSLCFYAFKNMFMFVSILFEWMSAIMSAWCV